MIQVCLCVVHVGVWCKCVWCKCGCMVQVSVCTCVVQVYVCGPSVCVVQVCVWCEGGDGGRGLSSLTIS